MRQVIVITSTYHRLHTLQQFVDCISRQTYPNYLLILVNDGGSKDIDRYAEKHIKNLQIIYGNGNLWWAGGINKAYKYIKQRNVSKDAIVLIANDDISFGPEFFREITQEKKIKSQRIYLPQIIHRKRDHIEKGYFIDWGKFQVTKNEIDSNVDALTTRALYMTCESFLKIGPMYPRLLPQYLSDIEYSYRAKKKGFELLISKNTIVEVNSYTTGQHEDRSHTLSAFLFNHFLNKRASYNVIYWGNFVLLTCPPKLKIKNFIKVYYRFFIKLRKFLLDRAGYLNQRSSR